VYWKLYASEAEISDQKLVETLVGDTNSMLILVSRDTWVSHSTSTNPTPQNGIFSSIIGSFILQTSQSLQPSTGQQTVCLLTELVQKTNQQSSQSCSNSGAPTAIRSNILLLLSFTLAMISVLACALLQQWCREFLKHAYPRAAPHKRGRVRTYLLQGLNRFHVRRFMYGVHGLLHISVFMFFCGVSDYLHGVYPRVGLISWYCIIALTVAYLALSILPLIIGNCPYQTALTPPLRFGTKLPLFLGRVVWHYLCQWRGKAGSWPQHEDLYFQKSHFLAEEANARAAHLDPYALKWLFTDDDFTDTDMDMFLAGLPGYIYSHFTVTKDLPKILTAPYILQRIREHLLTCVTATELSEEARIRRVSACVDSLRVILQHRTSVEGTEISDGEKSLQANTQSIVDGLSILCEELDKTVDLRAFCVRALAFQGFLTKCLEQARDASSDGKFPDHFIPLYTFFSLANTSQTHWQDTMQPPAGVSDENAPANEADMWRALLHDGPLINLTLLARAILSHDGANPPSLSMCWKTLDILRREFRITRVDVSDSSLALFNEIHETTRHYVRAEEPGFSVIPLLEILDAVAGGRRLSMVFQDHSKYCRKADLVFGMDHLRNPDLFRAFANCLPDFVIKHPEKSTELMEGLVCYDYLWASLQDNLWNSLRSNNFIPTKLRVFDSCCTVINAAFVALENSQKVDWRAPDFGSLAHYFELFVTDCFQGMFVERSIGFRVGLVKARFCKAVLAQFLDEFDREGTIIFRSHWDVASLARVLYSLGVGNDADVEFWKSFVDGGHIGPDFMARTHTILGTAARDGPLLNFCKLGHLGIMAVPFKGSGLEDADVNRLLDLLQKMREDSRLPLTLASTPVWDDLRQLRGEVVDICERNSGKDKANMQALLVELDAVYIHHPSSTQEHRPSVHVQAQASGTSTVVEPNLPPRGLTLGNDTSSYASASAVIKDRRVSSPTQEVDFGGTFFTLWRHPV
jgi:hypothetical protein